MSASPAMQPDCYAPMPLTAPQAGMWAGQQLDPDSAAYWTAEAIELEGELDVDALVFAISQTLSACDALHMRYESSGAGVCQRLAVQPEVAVQRLDLSAAPALAWTRARAWMTEDLQASVDLARGPLFACAVICLGPQRHLWYLRAHHIALDGFAYLLLIHRVADAYSARRRGEVDAATACWSLRRVIEEDSNYQSSVQRANDRAFWAKALADAPPPATLALPLPPQSTTRSQRAMLPSTVYRQWQLAASACGVDWGAWLLAAIAVWVHARTAACDISIGLLMMNRLGSAALGVPCMAMNVVPLRIQLEPDMGWRTLVRAVAETQRRLRPHRRYNYEYLRADHGLAGSHRQLYGPVVNLMPFDRWFVFDGVASRAYPVSVGAVDDLDITVSPMPEGVRFDIEANPAAYSAKVLHAHHASLLAIIHAATHGAERTVAELMAAADAMSANPVVVADAGAGAGVSA